MGLDVLYHGGYAGMVYLQRLVILWLCLLPSLVSADPLYVSADAYGGGSRWYEQNSQFCDYLESKAQAGKPTEPCEITTVDRRSVTIDGESYPNVLYLKFVIPVIGASNPTGYGHDFEGENPTIDDPEDCFEVGQVYDPKTQECTLNCPEGELNGQCLVNADECNPDRPDYMGKIGTGGVSICGDDLGACGSGSVGIVNGKVTCVASDYGPPNICPEGSISRYDTYGFTCEQLPDGIQNPQWGDGPPNVDTNGDGVMDGYDPRQDPASDYYATKNIYNQNSVIISQNTITNNNLNSIDGAIKQGNAENAANLDGIAGALGGMASDVSALKQMGENGELGGGGSSGGGEGLKNEAGEDYLGDLADIKQNTLDTADTLEDMNTGPDETNIGPDIPTEAETGTVAESIGRMNTAIMDNPTVTAFTTIPSLPSVNTCPTWTIPGNQFWTELVIDSHCAPLENNRGLLSALMIGMWSIVAAGVFLRG